jgi:hypothetical protein
MDLQLQTAQKIVELERKVETAAVPEKSIDLISPFLALPGLRAFWPMSAVDYTNPQCIDIANGYDLTNNNTATFGYDPNQALVPCVFLDGTNQYLSRADGGAANWADITGTETYIENTTVGARGLTLGGWFWFDRLATTELIIGKVSAAAGNYSYWITKDVTNVILSNVSVDGTAVTQMASAGTITTGQWYNLILRHDPSASLDIIVNNVQTRNVAGIPASIFDGNAAFEIGRFAGGSYLDGRASCCFLCAALLSDAQISSLYQQTRGAFSV